MWVFGSITTSLGYRTMSNRKSLIDWYNRQSEANQQTNLQQMVYEQSQLIGTLIEEVKLLRNALVESNVRGDK